MSSCDVTFVCSVNEPLIDGHELCVVGDSNALGAWSLNCAVRLAPQNPDDKKTFEVTVSVDARGVLKYCYIIVFRGFLVRQEIGFRNLCLTGKSHKQIDVAFPRNSLHLPAPKPENKIFVRLTVTSCTLDNPSHFLLSSRDDFGIRDFSIPLVPDWVHPLELSTAILPSHSGSIANETALLDQMLSPLVVRFELREKSSGNVVARTAMSGRQLVPTLAGSLSCSMVSVVDGMPLGYLELHYCVITPIWHPAMLGEICPVPQFEHEFSVDCGHRGSGANPRDASSSRLTPVVENTVLSFNMAGLLGAEFVEFDVQMTKDNQLMIHHDFYAELENGFVPICQITRKQWVDCYHDEMAANASQHCHALSHILDRLSATGHTLRASSPTAALCHPKTISTQCGSRAAAVSVASSAVTSPTASAAPTAALAMATATPATAIPASTSSSAPATATAVQQLPASPATTESIAVEADNMTSSTKHSTPGKWHYKIDTEPATFAGVLTKVHPSVGFDIEVKYANSTWQAAHNMKFPERNRVVDAILKDVFDLAGSRRLFFSSFDPDIALMLSLKQRRYPVFLLSMIPLVESDIDGADARCTSWEAQVAFVAKEGLAGVILPADVILLHPEYMEPARRASIKVLTYGVPNANKAKVQRQLEEIGVTAVISDNVPAMLRANKLRTPPSVGANSATAR